MKYITKKTSIFSLVILSLLLITSCEDNDNESSISETLEARFTRTMDMDGRTFTFINISENATSYSWDFGDGTNSTLVNPIKKFTNEPQTVTLTASNDDGASSTFNDSFTVDGCIDDGEENIDPSEGNINLTFLNTNEDALFDAFGNIGGGIVTNPVLDDVNASCNVFLYSKITGCKTWSAAGYEFSAPLDFSTTAGKIFKIKVLAETQPSKVTMVLERISQSSVKLIREATISEIGKWEELTFDFSGVTSGTYKVMIIYFERDTACDGDVYYFDDIIQQ
jgi:hypothetical protein